MPQDFPYCQAQNLATKPERPVLDVVQASGPHQHASSVSREPACDPTVPDQGNHAEFHARKASPAQRLCSDDSHPGHQSGCHACLSRR